MLDLSDITLFAIDCFHPDKTVLAMRFSCRFVQFKRVVLYTDLVRHPNPMRFPELKIEHIRESDEKREPFPGHPSLPVDYERDAITRPSDFGGPVLFMEWDSAILNPWAWDENWMKYDYIGAPWPPHVDPGWPACDESNNVGNGGFSLRSRKFNEKVRWYYANTHPERSEKMSSDRWFCRSIRKDLEADGILFAPDHVAARFSCENMIYSGQFAYHGKSTVALNGWSSQLFDEIKKGQNPLI